MRAPRNLSLLAALLVLLLALAACGNDPEEGGEDAATEGGGDTATEEAADDGTEATDEATEAAGGAESDALVDLETVCQEDYADVEVPEGFSVGLVTDIGSVDDGWPRCSAWPSGITRWSTKCVARSSTSMPADETFGELSCDNRSPP